MNKENFTSVTDFVLTGLEIQSNLQGFIFLIILLIYILTLVANLSIMIISAYDASLHTPMYFFLYNLAILDIFYSSSVVPKMLTDLVSQKKTISYYGCMLQVHFFHFLGSAEVALFSVMSFDRYVAIAHPLRYMTIMSYQVCCGLAFYSWTVGFSHALVHTIMTSRLPFCGVNVVEHFFCDIKPLLKLACTDVSLNIKLLARFTGPYAACHLVLTMLSYIFIGKCLIKIKTSQGRKRALSTCSGHFTVVTLQYGTVLFTYARPSSKSSLVQDRAAAIMFTVITPALNPILYTLRNNDFKKGLKKFFKMSH
ncbi:hypothetical protein GDO81_020223 [Engystomops pustulosus]|uniref:G-protein coupled receptors family 1 profile domain-containing protein n=1 Tax=Engystomops pustulosus TaxID=76066 RepID=A0AAV6ZJT5_ENGPU|nr:hypothetical protein GDO81_020223 [Engystomops pustulosus]